MRRVFLPLILISLLLITINFIPDKTSTIPGNLNASTIYISEDEQVIKAAKDKLNSFLQLIPYGNENLYGFESRADFLKAEPGTPFRIYTLSPEFINHPKSEFKNYLIPLNQWRVPVLINNRMVIFLTVEKNNEIYKCVDIGGAKLANELNDYEKYFNNSSQFRIIFRLYRIESDFLAITEKNKDVSAGEFYPLASAKMSLKGYIIFSNNSYKLDAISDAITQKYSEKNYLGR